MTDRTRFLMKYNRKETKLLVSESEEAFFQAKEKCRHIKSKYSIVFTDLSIDRRNPGKHTWKSRLKFISCLRFFTVLEAKVNA